MKKIISILVLVLVTFTGFSESPMDSCIRVQREKQKIENLKLSRDIVSNMDTITSDIDTIYNILSGQVKKEGWKKMIQRNSDLFLPIAIFILLYLLWLKGRKN